MCPHRAGACRAFLVLWQLVDSCYALFVEMENVTRGLPEGPARRAAGIARVGARYGFGYLFGRRFLLGRHRRDGGRVGTRIRLALEGLGPTFVELGHVLSARGDVLPPDVTAELSRASSPVQPTPFAEVRALVERELGNTLERLFLKFEETPMRVGVRTQTHQAVLPGDRPAPEGAGGFIPEDPGGLPRLLNRELRDVRGAGREGAARGAGVSGGVGGAGATGGFGGGLFRRPCAGAGRPGGW